MKRKFLVLLSIVVILAMTCSSCAIVGPHINDVIGGGSNEEPCEHTYSDSWSTSSTEHWHKATCEHAELKSDVAAHTDADENGKCDVCDYEIGHEHTYADTWTSNDTHHWKNATCSHATEQGYLAPHADANSDGSCDDCSVHVHVLNIYGYCTVCNTQVTNPDVSNVADIIAIVLSNTGKVTGGTIAESVYASSVADGSSISSDRAVVYVLGNAAAYYETVTTTVSAGSYDGEDFRYEYTDTMFNWYEGLEDGSVFGVFSSIFEGYESELAIDGTASTEKLIGYYYSVSTLADAYGAEDLLDTLYKLSQSSSASNYVNSYENGTYSFSYAYLYVNTDTAEGEGNHVDYYEVSVSFTVSDNGVLTGLNVECDCYTNSSSDEADHDYTYDQNSNTITLKDTAVADTYKFVISQTEGERTYVSEHPMSDFVPQDFDIYLDAEHTTELGETVTGTEGEFIYFYLGNFTPVDADPSFLAETFATQSELICWAYYDTVTFMCGEVGSYPVEFSLGGKTYSFTLVVEAYVPDDGGEQPDNTVKVEVTGANTYTWDTLVSFTAPADGDYTFYIEAEIYLGAWTDGADAPWADYYNTDFMSNLPVGGETTVSLLEGETYNFAVNALEKGIYYIPYTVSDYTGSTGEGGDSVNESNLVIGYNNIENHNVNLVYTASSNGVLTLKSGAAIMGNVEFSYAVNGADPISLALSSSVELTLNAGDNVVVYVVSLGYSTLEAVWAGESSEGGDVTVVQGTYDGTGMFGSLTVTIDATTVTFIYEHPMMGSSSLVATYEVVDGAVVLYDEDGNVLNPYAGILTIDENGVPVSADYNGYSYTLTVGEPDDTDDPDVGGGDDTTVGTMDNPIVIEGMPFETTLSDGNDFYYVWEATHDCTLIITGASSYCDGYDYENTYDGDNILYKTVYGISAGDVVSINLWYPLGVEGDVSVSIVTGVPAVEGSSDRPIYLDTYDSNVANYPLATDDGLVWYTYESYMNGTLSLTFNGNVTVMYGYGTEVDYLEIAENVTELTIDIYSYSTYYFAIASADGEAAEISFSAETAYKMGSADSPYVLEEYVGDHICNYVDEAVWYTFSPSVGGYVTVTSSFADVNLSGGTSIYVMNYAENGSVTFYVDAYYSAFISIGNFNYSPAEIGFSVTFVEAEREPDGSYNAPFTAVLGENTCEFAGGSDLVWYAITVDSACTITVSCDYVSETHNDDYHTTSGCEWIVISSETNAYTEDAVGNLYSDDGIGSDVTYTVADAGTYYVGICDFCENAATFVFTITVS